MKLNFRKIKMNPSTGLRPWHQGGFFTQGIGSADYYSHNGLHPWPNGHGIRPPVIRNILILAILVLFSFLNISAVLAATSLGTDINAQAQAFINTSGLKRTSISYTIAQIIKAILGFLGVIFIILIIYAGFLWMTSTGNEEKVTKAKKIIVAAIIGLAITLSAYAITIYVTDKIIGATIRTSTLGWSA